MPIIGGFPSGVAEKYGWYMKWEPILYYYADSTTTTLTSLNITYGIKWFSDNTHFVLGISSTKIAVCIMDDGYPRVISSLTVSSLVNLRPGWFFDVFDNGTYKLICVGSSASLDNTYLIKVAADWGMSFASSTAFNTVGYVQAFSPGGYYLLRGTQLAMVSKDTGDTISGCSTPYSTGRCGLWLDDDYIVLNTSSSTLGLYSFTGSVLTLIGSPVALNGTGNASMFLSQDGSTVLRADFGSLGLANGLQIFSVSRTTGLSEIVSLNCSFNVSCMFETDDAYYFVCGGSGYVFYPSIRIQRLAKADYTFSIVDENLDNIIPNCITYNPVNGFLVTSPNISGNTSPLAGQAQAALLWKGTLTENKLVEIEYGSKAYRVVD